ncbi:MAG: ABC transporter permease [Erysipelotrichaceae bacterium]|nr:ABC transporter permease [Erysipelotrichaceae bacterium]MBO4538014.1 ABC transporter permease [Erysipelotrichaceae bacterium]
MKEARRVEFIFEVLRIVVALAVAYLMTLVFIAFISKDPLEAIYVFSVGPFSTAKRFGQMMAKFIPYMMTGLSMCLIYACNRFNLIAEGSYLMGGCLFSVVAVNFIPDTMPKVLAIGLGLLVGALAGLLVSAIPTLLREKLGVSEIVTSVMFNYGFLYVSLFLIKFFARDISMSYVCTPPIPLNAKLSAVVPRTLFHSGIYIVAVVVMLVCLIYFKTPFGYKVRIAGANADFAKAEGIRITGALIGAQLLAGAIAGMGGAIDIMGIYDRYIWDQTPGVGTDGLLVAVLARRNPALVPIAALLLAYMRTGAAILNYATDIPLEMVQMVQGIIILMIGAEEFLGPIRNRMIFNLAQKKEKAKEEQANVNAQ